MKIRLLEETDLANVLHVIETAFPVEENKVIMELATELVEDASKYQIRSLVAEIDNQIIGYVSYSPIFVKPDESISGYILAPLAVSPDYQKQGVGSNLIRAGIDILKTEGVDALMVYGDPNYYGRFGFNEPTARLFTPPYPLEYPFGWTGMMLSEKSVPKLSINFDCVESLSKPQLW